MRTSAMQGNGADRAERRITSTLLQDKTLEHVCHSILRAISPSNDHSCSVDQFSTLINNCVGLKWQASRIDSRSKHDWFRQFQNGQIILTALLKLRVSMNGRDGVIIQGIHFAQDRMHTNDRFHFASRRLSQAVCGR